jgi:hypothetical protein
VWVIRCETEDADAVGALVGALALDGFTVTVNGAVLVAAVDPVLFAPPAADVAEAAPAKPVKAKKQNRRATPG